jgi:hypothetical protein
MRSRIRSPWYAPEFLERRLVLSTVAPPAQVFVLATAKEDPPTFPPYDPTFPGLPGTPNPYPPTPAPGGPSEPCVS